MVEASAPDESPTGPGVLRCACENSQQPFDKRFAVLIKGTGC